MTIRVTTQHAAVLVVSACHYTLTALTHMLQGARVCQNGTVRTDPLLYAMDEAYPLPGCPVRAVFFVLNPGPGSEVWSSLLLLERYLCYVPAARVVVLVPELNTAQTRFLSALRGVTVWSMAVPVKALHLRVLTWLPDISAPLSADWKGGVLTQEKRVLQAFMVDGMDMRSVADQQCVSRKTAYTQRANAMKRLGVRNLQELLVPDRVFCRPVSRECGA